MVAINDSTQNQHTHTHTNKAMRTQQPIIDGEFMIFAIRYIRLHFHRRTDCKISC